MVPTAAKSAILFWAIAVAVSIAVAVAVPVLASGSDGGGAGATDTVTPSTKVDDAFIEPDVRRYTNVLPRDACEKIIKLGEAVGFPLEEDSIDAFEVKNKDNQYSQAINVMDESGNVNYPEIFEAFEPYIPNIAELIRSQRNEKMDRLLFPDEPPNRVPRLGWIFYRKYSPGSARNALIPHFDSNMHTVNIALNDDFTGGGLFYVKPRHSINPDYFPNQENDYFRVEGTADGVPWLLEHQLTYDWVNTLQRENTTGVVFPKLETGDALIHNYTVWHAVAPIQTGIRYSLVLFFDMHNPLLDHNGDFYDDYFLINMTIKHEIQECDPTTGKLVYIHDDIDVFWVNDEDDESLEIVSEDLSPGTWHRLGSYPGHELRAVRSVREGEVVPPPERRHVLASIVVEIDKEIYDFVGSFTTQEDCDIANSIEKEEL
jgi:hypothetical protein